MLWKCIKCLSHVLLNSLGTEILQVLAQCRKVLSKIYCTVQGEFTLCQDLLQFLIGTKQLKFYNDLDFIKNYEMNTGIDIFFPFLKEHAQIYIYVKMWSYLRGKYTRYSQGHWNEGPVGGGCKGQGVGRQGAAPLNNALVYIKIWSLFSI